MSVSVARILLLWPLPVMIILDWYQTNCQVMWTHVSEIWHWLPYNPAARLAAGSSPRMKAGGDTPPGVSVCGHVNTHHLFIGSFAATYALNHNSHQYGLLCFPHCQSPFLDLVSHIPRSTFYFFFFFLQTVHICPAGPMIALCFLGLFVCLFVCPHLSHMQ